MNYETEKDRQIIETIKRGYELSEVANLCNVSLTAVYSTRKKYGITTKPSIPEDVAEKILEDYFVNNRSGTEIIAKYNISRGKLNHLTHDARERYKKKTSGKHATGKREKIIELLDEDLTQTEIAERVGVSQEYVSKINLERQG